MKTNFELELIEVKSGRFMMSTDSNLEQALSLPARVSDFLIGKYPITQQQYESVMGVNPSRFVHRKNPVERVSWNDAAEFCVRLSELNGENYRLPTQKEWEYACKAGTTTAYGFGQLIDSSLANYDASESGEYRGHTTAVGSFAPNPWGIHDMHGNVREWCSDWMCRNPKRGKVNRGGSWFDLPENCRSVSKGSMPTVTANAFIGFRVVREI